MPRSGFTLIEILVVIAILVTLTALVVTAIGPLGAERVRNGGRIAQSAFLGARDRALHAGERRGLRLVRDPNNPALAIAFAYVQPLPFEQVGQPGGSTLAVARPDADGDHAGADATIDAPQILVVSGSDASSLFTLDSQGLMPPLTTRIRIPADAQGSWYVPVAVAASPPYYVTMQGGNAVIQLSSSVAAANNAMPATQAIAPGDANASAAFDLGNELLPQHALIPLPSGVVIDLARSPAVANWPDPQSIIDVLFSPRGTLTGAQAGMGPLHFLLRDVRDAVQGLSPIDPSGVNDNLVLSIFPQTGHVAVYPIDPTDVDGDGNADDLFRYAKLGSEAGR